MCPVCSVHVCQQHENGSLTCALPSLSLPLLSHPPSPPDVGDTPAITLADGTVIPAWHLHDGPQGVANGNKDVTCWPAALTAVQSWDPELMYQFGAAMGLEQYKKGSNVMLGPGVNLARL